MKTRGWPDLESDEKGDSLHAVVAPVHVVAHEQVVRVRRLTACMTQVAK